MLTAGPDDSVPDGASRRACCQASDHDASECVRLAISES